LSTEAKPPLFVQGRPPAKPSIAPRPAPPALSMLAPATGEPGGAIWLLPKLSADEKTKRSAADAALMQADILGSDATQNYRLLRLEIDRKQYDLVDQQLDAVLAKSEADPRYELLERELSGFAFANDALLSLGVMSRNEVDAWLSAKPRSAWAHYTS